MSCILALQQSPPHSAFPSFSTPILAPRAVTPSPLRGLTRLLHVTLPIVLTTCADPCPPTVPHSDTSRLPLAWPLTLSPLPPVDPCSHARNLVVASSPCDAPARSSSSIIVSCFSCSPCRTITGSRSSSRHSSVSVSRALFPYPVARLPFILFCPPSHHLSILSSSPQFASSLPSLRVQPYPIRFNALGWQIINYSALICI